jgi:para-aminobenzoate synthetase/4-amino-4-deoxychorismate lyase
VTEAAGPDVCFLLENRRAGPGQPAAFLFERPLHRVTARTRDALDPALAALDQERLCGRYVCGYVAYEAGPLMPGGSPHLPSPVAQKVALLDFFSFEARRALDSHEVAEWLSRPEAHEPTPAIYGVERTETKETYCAKIGAIKEHIRSGDTYQVNFTLMYRFDFQGSSLSLYRALRDRQRVEFGAYIKLPECEVLSFSPELFVRRDANWLTSKPMKGTAPRGLTREEDERVVAAFQSDPKTLSENVMIVDLIRSDLGRIAEVGSVTADPLFEIQTFETVHQMVSTVRCKIGPDTSLRDVLASLFPCGSITGAPKVRTMEIIGGLEAEPRGIYTGAIGFATPGKEFCFSVPIRTVVTQGHRGEMGVGSGIVHESDAEGEFEECMLKARFLVGVNSSFSLLESMRFDAATGTVHGLEAHLARMRESAAYFEFAFVASSVLKAIDRATSVCQAGLHKVRVVLAQDGGVTASAEPLAVSDAATDRPSAGEALWVALSERRIDSSSCFQRHKTTERRLYDDEYHAWRKRGAYEVVFANERGEIAEASRHNVFIERNGSLITPPLTAGALGGIQRRRLLDDPASNAAEGLVSVQEFRSATKIFLTNSVRGVVPVVFGAQGGPIP